MDNCDKPNSARELWKKSGLNEWW